MFWEYAGYAVMVFIVITGFYILVVKKYLKRPSSPKDSDNKKGKTNEG
jgi:hypothetical protein